MTKSDDRLVEGQRKVQSLASNAEALRLPTGWVNWLSVGLGVALSAEPCQIGRRYCCIIGVWAEIVLGCLVPGRSAVLVSLARNALSLCWRPLYPAP